MTTETKKVFYPKNAREVAVYFATYRGKRLNIRVMNSDLDYVLEDVYVYSNLGSNDENFNAKKYRGKKWVSAGSLKDVWCIELVEVA